MTNDYSNFTKDLDAKIYPHAEPGQISTKDIFDCMGSSKSMVAIWLNKFITLCKTGKWVDDARVKKILTGYGVDKTGVISDFMRVASKNILENDKPTAKRIRKDQKMAADLAEIFSNAAGGWDDDFKTKAEQAQIMIKARRKLEKYDPEVLLRSAAFDLVDTAKVQKREGRAAELFIKHLKLCHTPIDIDKEELRDTYANFIQGFISDGDEEDLKLIAKEDATFNYESLLGIDRIGHANGKPLKIDDLSIPQLLKFLISPGPTSVEPSQEEIIIETTLAEPIPLTSPGQITLEVQEKIEEMFQKEFFQPFLANIAKLNDVKELHDFILAFLALRSAPSVQKAEKRKEIMDKFMGKLPPEIPFTDNLDTVYRHVVNLYANKVYGKQQFDTAVDKMQQFEPAMDLLEGKSYLEVHLDELINPNTTPERKKKLLERILQDQNSVPILAKVAKTSLLVEKSHQFILAILDLRSAPSDQKVAKIMDKFKKGGKSELPDSIPLDDLDVAYDHVVKFYLNSMFVDHLTEVDQAIKDKRESTQEI